MRVETIGSATLYLGDCREVIPGLPTIGSVITDPPFGMAFQSNYRGEQYAAIQGDLDDTLLRFAINIHVSHSRYVFCRWDNIASLPRPRSCITWVKNNWSMGDLMHEHARQTELICFYPGLEHRFPKYRPSDVIEAPRTGNQNHPTEKPVMLMMAIVEWTDGLVLDPFAGSGTTGVACAKLGRSFVGCEVHEPYFDIMCRRIEAAQRQGDLLRDIQPRPKMETGDLLAGIPV